MDKSCQCCRGSGKDYCARRIITVVNAKHSVVDTGDGVESDFTPSHAAGKDAKQCSCRLTTTTYTEASSKQYNYCGHTYRGISGRSSRTGCSRNSSGATGCSDYVAPERQLCADSSAP